MAKYIIKRILSMIPAVLIIVFVVFFILSLTPSSPAQIMLGLKATPEQVEALNEELGYNRPVLVRYADYIWDALHGDFGFSYQSQKPVFDILLPKFPTTLTVAILAVAVAVAIGIPLGLLSSLKPRSIGDNFLTVLSLFFASVPNFWLGLVFMLVFALILGWLPTSGIGTWKHFVMPVLTLALPSAAYISRLTRTTMLDALGQDYIRTAKGKGAKLPRVTFVHALRNAMMPVVTQLGMSFAGLLGGAVVVEIVFGLPGFGNTIVSAIKAKDVPIVMGAILFLSVTFMLIMLIVDIIYAFIDPRVKAQYQS